MQEIRFQHPHDHFIEVADEHLVFRQVALEDRTPNGSQISAASGFKPDQMPVVLMFLPNGSLEDIRPDEVVHLGSDVRRFIVIESDRTYFLQLTGHVLSGHAA
ncbi:multiubiquitin domain-containing protein [Enterobacter hormaechei]|uniref:multiubiquitin domain-containing protein n=1 Tax=Enterobacter hormaechei TaxID=158836 RepID=UPI001ED9D45D|nr:multiubiquitin domain-containing protein [Enterobacter hormaechei]